LIQFLSFIPLILGYLLSLMWANVGLGKWDYIYVLPPFNEVQMLGYFGYYGEGDVPLSLRSLAISGTAVAASQTVPPLNLYLYLALWTAALPRQPPCCSETYT
jgi:hypothetical protein